ncbi:hypothetical protein C8F04DRAFT_1194737 [Mycena alexandri]|uniref:Uncharacterized protein n=1 Tax=Mycena alexandri TaxID=1745969 RepID=A0AAD6S6M0_9AGAR|nr:hypothetical protein C8F04DRAFT_1194737 [Mycena alexandri]
MSCTTTTLLAPLIALVVVLALVVLRFGRPPRPTSIKRLCRWIRICDLRILTRRLFYAHPPTLDQLRPLDPLARVAAVAEFPNSYANDGYGATYVTAVVKDETLGDYHSGHITSTELLAQVRVKVGEAGHLTTRQRGYQRCNLGQTHFWLFCFYPKQHKAAEKMCHFSFLADAPRALLDCSCGTTHTEYWWLRDLGSFAEVEERIRDVLAHLGQPDLVRHDLRDVWLLSLLGFLSVFLSCSIVAGETQRENVHRVGHKLRSIHGGQCLSGYFCKEKKNQTKVNLAQMNSNEDVPLGLGGRNWG